MTEIKVCGITRLEDALCAVDCGAGALGFIFHPQSPRYLPPAKARTIIAALPRGVATVGVFVNESPGQVARIAGEAGIDLIQLHGDESPAYCRAFPPERLIKAVAPNGEADLKALADYAVRAFLIDARSEERYGGTGRCADWDLAARIARSRPLILAGGLKEDNIDTALSVVAPSAVDLNSGVEQAPGIKDHDRLRKLIARIRRTAPSGGSVIFGKGAGE
ncbi:MAG: phosphoribosylanthranilate isomerase [Deltaproteobacteria bacterium]|nr:phosphoribosylanthranilate isomerase [Deltaproteobacteria bacterium]